MTDWVVNSETALQNAIGDLRVLWRAHKYLRLNATTGRKRSLDQNSISHTWYEQIANELRENTTLGVKAECKLNYGVPILRAENEEFRAKYDALVKGRFSYEEKIAFMAWLPITSLMTKDQLSQYLVAMQAAYSGRVALTFPEGGVK